MAPSNTTPLAPRPRVGIPWRTSAEEQAATDMALDEATRAQKRAKSKYYEDAVRRAGGEPVALSLLHPAESDHLIPTLDAFVLPGSPADVDPAAYGDKDHGKSAAPDAARERTDRAVLEHAFETKKPVLAICYGCQLLNVYLGGTLIQDLHAETATTLPHRKEDVVPTSSDEPLHPAKYDPRSHLAALAGGPAGIINSSHHQAIKQVGRDLKVTAHAPDGTIEGVEWTGDPQWVIGVQWHPERMVGDSAAEKLFANFVEAAGAAKAVPQSQR